jgi:hypothetical protein
MSYLHCRNPLLPLHTGSQRPPISDERLVDHPLSCVGGPRSSSDEEQIPVELKYVSIVHYVDFRTRHKHTSAQWDAPG